MTTTCTPCVVDSVSAMLLGRHARPARRAAHARARVARASRRSTRLPARPCVALPARAARPSRRASARDSGPNVPAFRYAYRSSTGNARALSAQRHRDLDLHRRMIGQQPAVVRAPLVGPAPHRGRRGAPRTRTWSMPGPGRGEAPLRPGQVAQRAASARLDVEVAREHDDVLRPRRRRREPRRAQQLGVGRAAGRRVARAVRVRDADRSCRRRRRAAPPARCAAPSPRRAARRAPSPSARACASRKRRGFSVSAAVLEHAQRGRRRSMAFPWPENAERRARGAARSARARAGA